MSNKFKLKGPAHTKPEVMEAKVRHGAEVISSGEDEERTHPGTATYHARSRGCM